jgi:GMP synthase (glutamine-hydrolysing)
MIDNEIECFSRALGCGQEQIHVFDLLTGAPRRAQVGAVDMVLLGGSGDYSVSKGGFWLEAALEAMRDLHAMHKPTFASCWGFQAMARALGGTVVADPDRAELGTEVLSLTTDGEKDPLFAPLGKQFPAHVGHQDTVDRLPDVAVLLASTSKVSNQAFRVRDAPIYCTQFHPELMVSDMTARLATYPEYVPAILGVSLDEFVAGLRETPEANGLLSRFVQQVFPD